MGEHLGGEAPGARTVGVGRTDLLDGALVGERAGGGDRGAVVLVAAGAADAFAGHADGPGSHELDGRAVGVERLE